jgi:sugar lactone lactonase YvrE
LTAEARDTVEPVRDVRRLLDGGTFFEGPRWHDGRWWVSDFFRHVVLSFDADGGDVREEAQVPGQPSGLGWTPDGDLLVVSMVDRCLLRRRADGALGLVADLSGIATGPCNDMVVGPNGDAWIGNMGFDFWNGGSYADATLAHVDPSGVVTAAAEDLRFPNGSVITPDGSTLIVGESFASRYTAFDIGTDGSLTGRRTWAELPGVAPDGCGLDADGRIWCADALGSRCLLVEEGGRIVTEVAAPDGLAVYACMLGGEDGRTLALCCAPDSDAERRRAGREAAIYTTDVEVGRAGLP